MSSVSSNQSTNDSTNQSSSTPSVMETPENGIIDQISGVASGLAGQMLNWANGVFAKTSQITDQAVGNFFNVSQQMQGLSNNLTDQYNNVFAPQNRSLAREADSYNSSARQAVDMGMAGATQAQAGDQGLKNSEEALRSYGIDPSSGRYAALDKAAAVQNAANVAGAENMQRVQDANTGQRLRSEAVQVGATLPAAISNVNNTAIQANTGASNASLANANTGRNLFGLPNDYLKTAMEVKLPPTGNTSQSTGQSKGQSTGSSSSMDPAKSSPDHSGGGSGAGGSGAGAGGGRSSPGWMPEHGGEPGISTNGEGGFGSATDWDGSNSFSGSMDYSGQGNQDYGATDFGGDGSFNGSMDYSGDQGNQDYSGTDNSGDSGFNGSLDYGNDPGTTLSGGDTYGGEGFRMGGAIPQKGVNRNAYKGPRPNFMANGGQVDPSMSPSGGQQTDDVRAQGPAGSPINLNANEFVIPDDVAKWKGQEFFQKLILDSRKRFQQAPAHGQQMPQR